MFSMIVLHPQRNPFLAGITEHVCRGFVVLDVVANRQLQQRRYRRKARTQNVYRCILHGKTARLQLLLTAHL